MIIMLFQSRTVIHSIEPRFYKQMSFFINLSFEPVENDINMKQGTGSWFQYAILIWFLFKTSILKVMGKRQAKLFLNHRFCMQTFIFHLLWWFFLLFIFINWPLLWQRVFWWHFNTWRIKLEKFRVYTTCLSPKKYYLRR